jgi:hypothetical protein
MHRVYREMRTFQLSFDDRASHKEQVVCKIISLMMSSKAYSLSAVHGAHSKNKVWFMLRAWEASMSREHSKSANFPVNAKILRVDILGW